MSSLYITLPVLLVLVIAALKCRERPKVGRFRGR